MRPHLRVKSISLVVLGVASALVSSSIPAHSRGVQGRAKPATRGVQAGLDVLRPSTTVDEIPRPVAGPRPAAEAAVGEVAEPLATFSLKEFEVMAVGPDVLVSATADLSDKRAGVAYFWSLQVADGTNRKLVFDRRHYTHQVFTMPAEGRMRPTFDEQLRLGPGHYRVEVALSHVPIGVDFAKLADDEWAERHQVIRYHKRITITP